MTLSPVVPIGVFQFRLVSMQKMDHRISRCIQEKVERSVQREEEPIFLSVPAYQRKESTRYLTDLPQLNSREKLVIIVNEEMQTCDMHRETTRNNLIPFTVFALKLIQEPMLQKDSHVDVILEMSVEITTSNIVYDMEFVVSHDELIAESTGFSLINRRSEILREPNW